MADYLVIVESPAKAKTIKKYLGSRYSVTASMGHLRDLPKSALGVDLDNHFQPRYITIRGKGDLLSSLKKQAKAAKKVFLATDPDREGEAISWHLQQVLGVEDKAISRVTFNEITKSAVQKAIKEPREIDKDLVDAQQARRVLDRIVGYQISPLLWKKVKKGLSAGRVQSVATRLIVDREEEIDNFETEEYWTIDAMLTPGGKKEQFAARFYGSQSGKLELHTEAEAQRVIAAAGKEEFTVISVKEGKKSRTPAPPFTTSTMQQEASRKINYSAKKTMQAAQQLYEGVDVEGVGTVGLITYMRTDSLRVSLEAQAAAAEFIKSRYGSEYAPSKPRQFKTKKNAQDAHEAIRPTDVNLTPDRVKSSLRPELFKLYKLIWERFVASQMSNAEYDTVAADIGAGEYLFKASGSKVAFAGFTKLYVEGKDEKEEEQGFMPKLAKGQALSLVDLDGKQHFTAPPPRYTEATLIKAMEEDGIGRPSTYAPTITTIMARGYVAKEAKQLYPTELGTVITQLMKEHFANIVDVDFTAEMENNLDLVEEGKENWVEVLEEFYDPFEKALKKAEKEIGNIEIKDEVSDVPCDKCGRMMVYKMGRYGKFLACPGFPECRNAKPIVQETGVDCPDCGGRILVKKSKRGKLYYGCEHNPACGFMSWDMPTAQKCPRCGKMLLKKTNRNGGKLYCTDTDGCGYEQRLPKGEE